MRYGLVADVHANLPALRACLDVLERSGVDAYLCAGDIVGYGPQPNECVEVIAALPGVCVAGNHDLIAIGRLAPEGIGELARVTLDWTRTVLTEDSRAWLGALPLDAVRDAVAVAHGSRGDPRVYVTTDELAANELTRLPPATPTLVLGHTHRPLAFGERSGRLARRAAGTVALPASERRLINPGAVGQSRDRSLRARVAVLDLDASEVTFHGVRYDVAATIGALDRAGLPRSAVQLRPRRSLVRAGLRRLINRVPCS